MIIPFSEMPGFLGTIGKVLPSGALSEVLQSCLRSGAPSAGSAWIVLAVWAVLAPLAAVKFFRWE
jgi:ABC-2 type transport system permease protein